MPALSQFGAVAESVYGTPVTVTKFWPFRSEDLTADIERIDSEALMAARVLKSSQWQPGQKSVGGEVEIELINKSLGLLLLQMFGAASSAQPDAAGNPTVWKHTYTPGTLVGKSLTTQVGKEIPTTGVVQPFTYHGMKVANWELACAVGELAVLTVEFIGEDEDTATSLAVATYPSGVKPMSFVQGSLTIGGSAVPIREFSIEGDNNLEDDTFKFGSQLRDQPLEIALRDYTGEIDARFDDLTLYNRYISGAEAALVLTFAGDTISSTYKYETKVTANVRFDGATPTVGGQEEIRQPLEFRCLNTGSGDDTAIKVEYQTTDTTAT